MEALCDPATSFESSYISCGGSGRNTFATVIVLDHLGLRHTNHGGADRK